MWHSFIHPHKIAYQIVPCLYSEILISLGKYFLEWINQCTKNTVTHFKRLTVSASVLFSFSFFLSMFISISINVQGFTFWEMLSSACFCTTGLLRAFNKLLSLETSEIREAIYSSLLIGLWIFFWSAGHMSSDISLLNAKCMTLTDPCSLILTVKVKSIFTSITKEQPLWCTYIISFTHIKCTRKLSLCHRCRSKSGRSERAHRGHGARWWESYHSSWTLPFQSQVAQSGVDHTVSVGPGATSIHFTWELNRNAS